MEKRLYVAYGSNLNIRQMKHRCPTAKLYGTGVIEDHELQFKGHSQGAYATIAPKEGFVVPVAVWEIQPRDELSLDRYEGYPSHYFKQEVPVKLKEKTVGAMVYIMNPKMDFGMPSPYYYRVVYEGYEDCGLNTDVLLKAVVDSAEHFYSSVVHMFHSRSVFTFDEEEDLKDEEAEDEGVEESDSFYSGGMQI